MNFLMASVVGITNLCGAVSVDTHGACVTSYVPKNGSEVIFMSQTGTGGIPLCWPWFAGLGPFADSRRHGLARYCEFELAGKVHHSPRDSELVFRLESGPDTRRMFPHDFELTVSVRLTDCLTISMTGKNTGKEPFKVTEALHPYFAVSDQTKCVVEGLETQECRLSDTVSGRVLAFTQQGSSEYYVWRPNPQSHLAKNVSPIMPDDWRRFICVENGTFRKDNAYFLKPGESHTLVRSIKVVKDL
jgi:glucose-6-phosphate 1-epimerase